MATEEIEDSEYGQVGWYHVTEIDRLFTGLEAAAIRFYFETQETGVSGIDPVIAYMGGSFGQEAQVSVYVHLEDMNKFKVFHEQEFESKPKAETPNWRDQLRTP